jgi:hypothetical protein
MKVQLKTAVKKMVDKNARELRYYLLALLKESDNERIWLREGEVVEITYKDITVSFTWEMISVVNCKTNKYIDLISIKNVDEVIEFFESSGLIMPICPIWEGYHCPVCDDDWYYMGITYAEGQRINKLCCEGHRDLTKKELREY